MTETAQSPETGAPAPAAEPVANAWATGPGATPADQLAVLKADPSFMAALASPHHSLNRQAQARWDAAHVAAHAAEKSGPGIRTGNSSVQPYEGPPADPAAYQLPPPPDGTPALTGEDDAEWRGLAHVAGLAPDDVNFLTVAAYTATRNPGAIDEGTCVRQLAQRHGADGATNMITQARSVLASLPAAQRERAKEWLENSGLGNSSLVIERLAMIAERRAGGRK